MNRPSFLLAAALCSSLLLPGAAAADDCDPLDGHLCLQEQRFETTVLWWDAGGASHRATAVPVTDDTGWFWFFEPTNVELMLKVLDGRPINGSFWVFAGALSDIELEIRIDDLETGAQRLYRSAAGERLALRDLEAFAAVEASSPTSRGPSPQRLEQAHLEEVDPAEEIDQALPHAHCELGRAAGFPCRDVDLQALVPLHTMTPRDGSISGNDIWGWTDPGTGREIALMGLSDGVSFVDITEPTSPRVLGHLATATRTSIWRDIKTYRNHAFVIADSAEDHGMQVFDLRRLRGRQAGLASFEPDAVYLEFGSAHNLAIDERSGFAFAVGTGTCSGGLHMIDIREPTSPRFAGCFADDGYTHDAQCVTYRGPDAGFRGRQVCFAANEDSLTIVDVTDKNAPRQIARRDYEGRGYTHQGWLTEDSRYFLVDDETDERNHGHGTRTYIWDVRDLERPRVIGVHESRSSAIDHNQYTHKGYTFQANYRSGLRVLDLARVGRGQLTEVAFFDLLPDDDDPGFSGAWSVYPYFPSGNVVVSGTGQGLLVLQPLLPGFAEPEPLAELSAEVAGTTVELRWTLTDHHADGVRVYRSVNGSPEALLAELAPGTSAFFDRELNPLDQATYRLVALRDGIVSAPVSITVTADARPSECIAGGRVLCLGDERFAVEVSWASADGEAGDGATHQLTPDGGAFWFFDSSNLELVVKVVDGRPVNDKFWVFVGGLSDVAYTLRITDTANGRVRTFINAAGTLQSLADIDSFSDLAN